MKKFAGMLLRGVFAFPLVFPVFLFTITIFAIESLLWQDRGYFHPVSDFLDRIWLDPWNNFIDYGSFRCS